VTVAIAVVLLFILVALVFEFINGFHDTANSIATVVATKVLNPTQAVVLAASTNLVGALAGEAVARTISTGLVDASVVTMTSGILMCGLVGGIIWNLITWWYGMPSSSSHAMIGGLCGSAVGAAEGNWGVLIWAQPSDPWWKGSGILYKIVIPMVSSPVAGFLLGLLLMGGLYALISFFSHRRGLLHTIAKPRWVNAFFGKAQLLSASYMGFAHGLNDAQKTMGLIALALVGAQTVGTFEQLPPWLEFLRPASGEGAGGIATWIKITCALVMAAGTAVGGWRIIRTLGHKMVKLHPIHGFAAETASATILSTAAHFGMPVSTTHSISTAIMGVGFAKSARSLHWVVVERILWAWILTLPITGAIGFMLVRLAKGLGWIG
jgi:PiT family inorganic phosphate transporter